jgi:hypothetical protein
MQISIRLDRLNDLLNHAVEKYPEYTSTLLIDSQELKAVLENVGLVDGDITGAVVLSTSGDYVSVWLTEGNRPDWLGCYYHPLPYFHSTKGVNIPYCEMETNEYYQRS